MSTNIKGSAGIVISIFIALIFIGGIGYYYVSKNKASTLINVASASVTIISPNNEEQWVVGTKQIIKWSSFNLPEKTGIGIQLANPDLDEDGFWGEITSDSPNSGEYTWEVPKTIKNGPYKIYIYTHGTGEKRVDLSDDALIYISGSTAVPPKITKIFPSSGSLPPNVITEVVNKNEVKEITIFGSGFNTKREDYFTRNNGIYFSSGTAFALFRNLSLDGHTLTFSVPSSLGAGKITEDVVSGTYEIFVETASGKSNSVYITLTKPTDPIYPQGKEIFPSGIESIPTPTIPNR